MNLKEDAEVVTWPETHYVFVEKIGPFMDTAAKAWQELHQLVPSISEHNKITGYLALYKIEPKIYRAGVSLAAPPESLTQGLESTEFKGGKYSRFVLTGSYADLPHACSRVLEIISETRLQTREDYHIENYVNDPTKTPESQLITEILVPIM